MRYELNHISQKRFYFEFIVHSNVESFLVSVHKKISRYYDRDIFISETNQNLAPTLTKNVLPSPGNAPGPG